jgi:hypothetical protein
MRGNLPAVSTIGRVAADPGWGGTASRQANFCHRGRALLFSRGRGQKQTGNGALQSNKLV